MSEKLQFIDKAREPGANISALCHEFGISRQTGHKWIRRYLDQGYEGLAEQSRRPNTSPLTTGEEIVVSIVEWRERRPSWGPDKIARVLARKYGAGAPSRSTVARVLKRLGISRRRRPRIRIWTVDGRPHVEVKAPNDLWTLDLKGWWYALNREKCEPLTVRDAFSRKVLAVALGATSRGTHVRRVLENLFERHGLPVTIQTDNGSPFVCTRARGGLTKLSAWLISLGIRLVRSRPGCPQDNGGHERMHRDLSELQRKPARSRRAQQSECDRWMVDFNEVRPHDALGGKTPAEVYRDSPRRSLTPLVPSYPAEWKTRRVSAMGSISVNDDVLFVSAAIGGQIIGLQYEGGIRWRAHYFNVDLGSLEIAPFFDAFTGDLVSSSGEGMEASGDSPKEEKRKRPRTTNRSRRRATGGRRGVPSSQPRSGRRHLRRLSAMS
jgi:putative transposase